MKVGGRIKTRCIRTEEGAFSFFMGSEAVGGVARGLDKLQCHTAAQIESRPLSKGNIERERRRRRKRWAPGNQTPLDHGRRDTAIRFEDLRQDAFVGEDGPVQLGRDDLHPGEPLSEKEEDHHVVEVGMKDDQVGDGFGRNAQLSQLIQEGEGDPAHAPFHDGVCFPFNEVEVEVGAPEKIDSWCNLLRKRHRSKITNQGSRIQGSED